MGKFVFLLIVAFVCSAVGQVDDTSEFRNEVGDFDDDLHEGKDNDIVEDTSMLGEEPVEDDDVVDDVVDDGDAPVEDEELDNVSSEKEAEEKLALPDLDAQTAVEQAQSVQLKDQETEAAASLADQCNGNSLKCHHHHRHYHHHRCHHHHRHYYHHRCHHHHHHNLRRNTVAYRACQSGSFVGGNINPHRRYIYRTIRFRPYFRSTPAIVHGIQKMLSNRYYNNRFQVQVVAKCRSYMRLKIYTWGCHNGLRYLYVNWMACPR